MKKPKRAAKMIMRWNASSQAIRHTRETLRLALKHDFIDLTVAIQTARFLHTIPLRRPSHRSLPRNVSLLVDPDHTFVPTVVGVCDA